MANERTLSEPQYLGQYGVIKKVVVNKDKPFQKTLYPSFSAYITFENDLDAAFAILAIDGFEVENSVIRATFGMTKYCTYFLRNQICQSGECLFLHKKARQEDIFTKEDSCHIKFTTRSEKEEVVKRICTEFGEKIKQRRSEKLVCNPILSSMARAFEIIESTAKILSLQLFKSAKTKKIKSAKSKKSVSPKRQNNMRWDEESDSEEAQSKDYHLLSNLKSKNSLFGTQKKETKIDEESTIEESRSSLRGSLPQTPEMGSPQPSVLSTREARSPIGKKQSILGRKFSKSNEPMLQFEERREEKFSKDFSKEFLHKHSELIKIGKEMMFDPLKQLDKNEIIQTKLDGHIFDQLNKSFYKLKQNQKSSFKFAYICDYIQDSELPKDTSFSNSLVSQYLKIAKQEERKEEEEYKPFGQTYEVKIDK